MATDATFFDIAIVDSTYNTKLKDAITDDFNHHVTQPIKLMRLIQKFDSNLFTPEDIDYITTQLRNVGRIAANDALLDRLHRYKNWFPCLMKAVNNEHIKLGFLEEVFQGYKDDLDEQILAATNEEIKNNSLTSDYRVSVSQRRENLRLKIILDQLKRQQEEGQQKFEAELTDIKNSLQKVSANHKKENATFQENIEMIAKNCEEDMNALDKLNEELKEEREARQELNKLLLQEKNSHESLKKKCAEEKHAYEILKKELMEEKRYNEQLKKVREFINVEVVGDQLSQKPLDKKDVERNNGLHILNKEFLYAKCRHEQWLKDILEQGKNFAQLKEASKKKLKNLLSTSESLNILELL